MRPSFLRYAAGKLAVTAEFGRTITGSVAAVSVNALSPQAGKNKLHVNVMGRYQADAVN